MASTTLSEPLAWINSTLLKGDAAQSVARLKQELGRDFVIMGSGELVQSLMRANPIDEYVLLIHPHEACSRVISAECMSRCASRGWATKKKRLL